MVRQSAQVVHSTEKRRMGFHRECDDDGVEVTQKNFICSLDAVCRALRPKKIFLAFEGHKGRKAKKGQNFPKNKYGSKCLKLPNSARNPIKIFSPL